MSVVIMTPALLHPAHSIAWAGTSSGRPPYTVAIFPATDFNAEVQGFEIDVMRLGLYAGRFLSYL